MDRGWITNGSPSVAPIVNLLNAACHQDFVPTDVFLLENPSIVEITRPATSMM